MLELEKTYLAKTLPTDLKDCLCKEIVDLYLPANIEHPTLRLRKNGDNLEITKKEPILGTGSSIQKESTIILNQAEYQVLSQIPAKKVRKLRYYFDYQGRTAEFDVFQDDLTGLVVVEFEFTTETEKDNFPIPDFCLADITPEKFIAGGMICGKKYSDVEKELARFNYKKLVV